MNNIIKNEAESLANAIVEGMQENKAEDIIILDLRKIDTAVCEFFVICSGESSTQIDGITRSVANYTKEELGEKPWKVEGKNNSEWVLLDYFNVVAHIFHKEKRIFFDLEDLWADAERTDIPNIN